MKRRRFIAAAGLMGIFGSLSAAMRNVAWPELFTEQPDIDYGEIFGLWSNRFVIDYEIAPIGMSAFGCIFFRKRDDSVHCVDPILGSVRQVAMNFPEFREDMNTEAWQIENLHSKFVAQIVTSGLARKPDEVFGLAPHPHFTGGMSLDRSRPIVLTARVWHSLSAQSF